jgi:putative addiction module killer protein
MEIKKTRTYDQWLSSLEDKTIKGVILARVERLSYGLMGDVEPVGEGVSELRIHVGAGWRVYFQQRGRTLILLLCGGSKKTQQTDIKEAKRLAKEWTGEEA